ncbi:MAG: phosphate ABC transporter permease subunit PstC, partial [Deltaproteobacteria bacterium]
MIFPDRYKADRYGDALFKGVSFFFAFSVIILLFLIIAVLFKESMPSLRKFGFGFLYGRQWDPVSQSFGGLAAIYGTVVSSIIAIVIAVPISLGIAIFLTEMAPAWLKGPIGTA